MDDHRIPDELVQQARAGNLIPFIGAGFSYIFGFPLWADLLQQLCLEPVLGLDYSEIAKACGDDYLRIAEYIQVKLDGDRTLFAEIIRKKLTPKLEAVQSSTHVELINLNAPVIYTTNYEDQIEKVFQELGLQPTIIRNDKELLQIRGHLPEIVKFHGDLADPNSLVLTQTSFFQRLSLESLIDLKFRADILGKSILFMGYSFKDLNIRYIWAKLIAHVQKFGDCSENGKLPKSYLVVFEQNEVLAELYSAVQIETIVLEDKKRCVDPEYLMSDFLYNLNCKVSADNFMPHDETKKRLYTSLFAIEEAKKCLNEFNLLDGNNRLKADAITPLKRLAERKIPNMLTDRVICFMTEYLDLLIEHDQLTVETGKIISQLAGYEIKDPTIATILFFTITRAASRDQVLSNMEREVNSGSSALAQGCIWDNLQPTSIDDEYAQKLIDRFDVEFEKHEQNRYRFVGGDSTSPKLQSGFDGLITFGELSDQTNATADQNKDTIVDPEMYNIVYLFDVLYRIATMESVNHPNGLLKTEAWNRVHLLQRHYPAIPRQYEPIKSRADMHKLEGIIENQIEKSNNGTDFAAGEDFSGMDFRWLE